MYKIPLSRKSVATWLALPILALALTGCFQSAGESVQPTPVSLTSIAPQQFETPTAFITPLPASGFALPTDDPNSFLTQTPVENNAVFPTEAPPNSVPTVEAPTLPPAVVPVVTATFLATPTGLPTEGPCVHTVQPGEWFYSIARKYNIDPGVLLAANPRSNPDALQPGDVLNIPNCNKAPDTAPGGASPTPTPPSLLAGATNIPSPIALSDRIYTVAAGDTLGSIARKWGVTVQALKEVNGLTSDLLHIGDQLKIPKP